MDNDWSVNSGWDSDNGWCTKLLKFTVVSNSRIRLCCESILMLSSCMSSCISCLYRGLFNAQLWRRLISNCCAKRACFARIVFQSECKVLLLFCSSWYLSFNGSAKLVAKTVDGVNTFTEGVDASDSASGNDKVVFVEISIGLFTKFGLL